MTHQLYLWTLVSNCLCVLDWINLSIKRTKKFLICSKFELNNQKTHFILIILWKKASIFNKMKIFFFNSPMKITFLKILIDVLERCSKLVWWTSEVIEKLFLNLWIKHGQFLSFYVWLVTFIEMGKQNFVLGYFRCKLCVVFDMKLIWSFSTTEWSL